MIQVKLKNDAGVRAILNNLALVTSENMAKAITLSAVRIEATMKAKCPKATGYTQATIDTEFTRTPTSITAKVGPSGDAYWAKYIEYGTGIFAVGGDGRKTPWVYYNEVWQRFVWTQGNRPQPFIYPALRANASFTRDIMKAAITEGWGVITKR